MNFNDVFGSSSSVVPTTIMIMIIVLYWILSFGVVGIISQRETELWVAEPEEEIRFYSCVGWKIIFGG